MAERTPTSAILWAILFVFAAVAVVEVFVVDLRYGPDEPAHFIYVRSIAEDLRLPQWSTEVVSTEESAATHQAHHPPLYYAVLAVVYTVAKLAGAGFEGIWYALRIATVLFGIGWIYFSWRLAGELFREGSLAPVAVTAFTAFLPLSTYMSSVINNDVPQAMFFTWALWLLVVFLRTGKLAVMSGIWLGLIIGLSILTKAQGLLLVPLLALALLMLRNRGRGKGDYTYIYAALAACGTAVLVSGWWFIRSYMMTGQIIPQTLVRPILVDPVQVLLYPQEVFAVLHLATVNLFNYFWTPYWITERFEPGAIYTWGLGLVTVAAIVGLLVYLLRARQEHSGNPAIRPLVFLCAAIALLYLSIIYQAIFVDWYVFQQGRLMLPVAAGIGTVLVVGLRELTPQRLRRSLFYISLALLLVANWAYLGLVRLFYQFGG
jgi:4-amino-4-deoxy-L-arabinose transferase-like glycosyltransferase